MKKHYKYKMRELPANIIHECSYSVKKLKDFCAQVGGDYSGYFWKKTEVNVSDYVKENKLITSEKKEIQILSNMKYLG